MRGLCPGRRRGYRFSGSADETLNGIDDSHALATRGEKHFAVPASFPAWPRGEMSSVLCAPSPSQETRVKYQNLFNFCKTVMSANLPDDAFHETQTKQESKITSSLPSPDCTPRGMERVLEYVRCDTRVHTLALLMAHAGTCLCCDWRI